MNKLVVRLVGGLGNQLFIYAAARRLSKNINSELIIDSVSGFENDIKYKRRCELFNFNIPCRSASYIERLEPFSKIRRFALRNLDSRKPFSKRNFINQEFIDFDERLLNIEPKKFIYLEGLWQSELYFEDIKSTIYSDLEFISPTDEINLEYFRKIKSDLSICIHLRFFDASENGISFDVSKDYYINAINIMINKFGQSVHFYVFSNYHERAKEYFSSLTYKFTYINHNVNKNPCHDLWLMKECKHFIIANSTFSWWAAWLSEYKNNGSFIIAPNLHTTSGTCGWGFEGLIPERWNII